MTFCLSKKIRKKITLPNIALFLTSIFILLFYLWTASNGIFDVLEPTEGPQDYHNMLADAFLHGQTFLRTMPSEQLLNLPDPYDPIANLNFRLHDASLYNGKYYLYFTPIVALFILAPFKLLTGYFLSAPLVMALLSYIGTIAGFLSLRKLSKKLLPAKLDFWVSLSCLLALSLVTTIPFSLRRPLFYEMCQIAAYTSLMVAVYYFVCSVTEEKLSYKVSVFGLFLGFTFLSRPSQLFSCIILGLGMLFLRYIKFHDSRKTILQLIIRVGIPVLSITIGMLIYNYVRYGSIGEFGINYQLTGSFNAHKNVFFSLRYIPLNIYNYVWSVPSFDRIFPFVHPKDAGLPIFFMYYFYHIPYEKAYEYASSLNYGFEEPIGLLGVPLFYLPIFLLQYCCELYNRYKVSLLIAILFMAVGGVSMVAVSQICIAATRYMIDFAPMILLSVLFSYAVFLAFLAEKSKKVLYHVGRLLFFLAAFVSSVMSIGLSLSGHGEVLKNQNPILYHKLESYFTLG